MSDPEHSQPDAWLNIRPLQTTHFADGSHVQTHEIVSSDRDIDPEIVRDVIADVQGLTPEDVTILERNGEPYDRPARRGKMAVAFAASRWNSTWDPKAANASNN